MGDNTATNLTNNPQYEYPWNLKYLKVHGMDTLILNWGVLVIARVKKLDVDRFIECVRVTYSFMGLKVIQPKVKFGDTKMLKNDMIELNRKITKYQFMMVIKKDTVTIAYDMIKEISKTYLKIL